MLTDRRSESREQLCSCEVIIFHFSKGNATQEMLFSGDATAFVLEREGERVCCYMKKEAPSVGGSEFLFKRTYHRSSLVKPCFLLS